MQILLIIIEGKIQNASNLIMSMFQTSDYSLKNDEGLEIERNKILETCSPVILIIRPTCPNVLCF